MGSPGAKFATDIGLMLVGMVVLIALAFFAFRGVLW
jgi:hypothetical protein